MGPDQTRPELLLLTNEIMHHVRVISHTLYIYIYRILLVIRKWWPSNSIQQWGDEEGKKKKVTPAQNSTVMEMEWWLKLDASFLPAQTVKWLFMYILIKHHHGMEQTTESKAKQIIKRHYHSKNWISTPTICTLHIYRDEIFHFLSYGYDLFFLFWRG